MLFGHLAALFCILVWSTTFVATKVLLTILTPLQILVIRFVLGVLLLYLMHPKDFTWEGKNEIYFIGAGFFGVFLYYLCDNYSLEYTMASNLSIIISVAPFFTAIAMRLVYKDKSALGRNFILGFLLAMVGIILISLDGTKFETHPFGDFLGLLGAIAWALYSVFLHKVNSFGHPTIVNTRKINLYGLIFMFPAFLLLDHKGIPWADVMQPAIVANLLFLGLIACAICFIAWNLAVERIGVMSTSIYIYLGPVVTIAASYVVLHEPLTGMKIAGTVLTLAGLVLSEKK